MTNLMLNDPEMLLSTAPNISVSICFEAKGQTAPMIPPIKSSEMAIGASSGSSSSSSKTSSSGSRSG